MRRLIPAWSASYLESRSVTPDVMLPKLGFQRLFTSAAYVVPVLTRCVYDIWPVAGLTRGCPSAVASVHVAVRHSRPSALRTPEPVTNTRRSRYPGKLSTSV